LANKYRKCYLASVTVRSCKVSCRDSRGVEHAVDVTAESLYEAVAQAVRVFRDNDWNQDPSRAPAAVVVRIKQPEIQHTVQVRDFMNWLDSAGKSPAEMALKARLRNMLGQK
jgi:hypothetical protein